MNEFVKNLIEKLEEYKKVARLASGDDAVFSCINIVKEFAEEFGNDTNVLSNGWIPCSERMPDEHDSIFAQFKGTDRWSNGMFERCSDTVNVTVVAKNGSRSTVPAITADGIWSCDLLRADSTCRVIAWMPLPEPYEEEKKDDY